MQKWNLHSCILNILTYLHTPPKKNTLASEAGTQKSEGLEENGGCGAPPTFHLAPFSFEYSARQNCIPSFGGEYRMTFQGGGVVQNATMASTNALRSSSRVFFP